MLCMVGVAQYAGRDQNVPKEYRESSLWMDNLALGLTTSFADTAFLTLSSVFPYGSDHFGWGRLWLFFPDYKIEYLIQKNLRKKETDRVGEIAQWIKHTCCASMKNQVQIPRTHVRSWACLHCACSSSTVEDGGRRIARVCWSAGFQSPYSCEEMIVSLQGTSEI